MSAPALGRGSCFYVVETSRKKILMNCRVKNKKPDRNWGSILSPINYRKMSFLLNVELYLKTLYTHQLNNYDTSTATPP